MQRPALAQQRRQRGGERGIARERALDDHRAVLAQGTHAVVADDGAVPRCEGRPQGGRHVGGGHGPTPPREAAPPPAPGSTRVREGGQRLPAAGHDLGQRVHRGRGHGRARHTAPRTRGRP